MSRGGRIYSSTVAAWRSFVRRRVAVFFTFFFPALLVIIFGALVGADSGGTLFARPANYYVAGYVSVVVLFTPLSRVSSEVARFRAANRFEKLATTPLSRSEWLTAQVLVNTTLVLFAVILILALVTLVTPASPNVGPFLAILIGAGTVTFCGLGAIIGRLADSRDGAITAANAIGIPLLFLSETFIPPTVLPSWFRPLLWLSPLTYFTRPARLVMDPASGAVPAIPEVLGLIGIALGLFVLGSAVIPWTN